MLFFKNKNKPVKPPSVLSQTVGMLVNPHINDTVRPLRDTVGVFINLLAAIFASQGLFPRNHPALNGMPGARLHLAEVLGIAWVNLTFTKESIPQVLLFFAVIASLGFSVLAVFVFLMSIFIGNAHAAMPSFSTACSGSGYFAPCDSSNDIALGWINYIFHNQPMMNYLSQYGQIVPQSTVIQQALITTLAFYSDAILVVAAIILFYHLVVMVVETAHTGVPMGKKERQIWAPIRLVVAIGLLVPIAGGLNSGQFIVIKVAEWGSNMASQAWGVFVQQLANDTYTGKDAVAPYARKTVYDTMMMEACAYAFNQYAKGAAASISSTGSTSPATITVPPDGVTLPNNAIQYVYTTAASGSGTTTPLGDVGVCGQYTFPPPPKTNDTLSTDFQNKVQDTAQQAFKAMQDQVRDFVTANMPYDIPPGPAGGMNDQPHPENTGQLETFVASYQADLQKGISSAGMGSFGSQMRDVAQTSSSQGWVSAGAWFNTVARTQSEMMDIEGLIPATRMPSLKEGSSSLTGEAFTALKQFAQWVNTPSLNTTAPTQSNQLVQAAAGIAEDANDGNTQVMDKVFMLVDFVASWNGVWTSASDAYATATTPSAAAQNFTLGVQFMGANPLAEIAYFGHANINTAYQLFDAYLIVTGLTGTADVSGKLSAWATKFAGAGGIALGPVSALLGVIAKAGAAIGSIISIFSIVFFTSGVVLAYFLPLIPFLRFMFNTLTWIVSLLEAVVAVPLIALGHLNPDGEGLAGGAKDAYHFIFNIFLRPILMVFGLMLGTIIFFIVASILNLLYMQAVVGTGGLAHGHLMLARFIYSLFYVFTLYMGANSAFHMIDWLPQHAMKWMGGKGLEFQRMGDPAEMQQGITLGTGFVESQLMSGVSKLGPGALAGGLVNQLKPSDLQGAKNQFMHDSPLSGGTSSLPPPTPGASSGGARPTTPSTGTTARPTTPSTSGRPTTSSTGTPVPPSTPGSPPVPPGSPPSTGRPTTRSN
jgi:conjugal transfer/type IV secretion protein DotA/TraY